MSQNLNVHVTKKALLRAKGGLSHICMVFLLKRLVGVYGHLRELGLSEVFCNFFTSSPPIIS